MRTVEVSLAGVVYQMPADFRAMEQIAERVGDPFTLASAMSVSRMLTAIQTVDTIVIGIRLAGCKLEREQIGQQIVEAGALKFLNTASKYVVAVCDGSAAAPVTGSKKKQSK